MKRYVLLRARAREVIETAMKRTVDAFNALPPPAPPPPAGIAAAQWYKQAIAADREADAAAKSFPKVQELKLLPTVTVRNARSSHSGRTD